MKCLFKLLGIFVLNIVISSNVSARFGRFQEITPSDVFDLAQHLKARVDLLKDREEKIVNENEYNAKNILPHHVLQKSYEILRTSSINHGGIWSIS